LEDQNQNIETLTNAFNDFNTIVSKFQDTFTTLQNKIEALNTQIEVKNLELEKKYAETENIKNFLNNILEDEYNGVIVIDNHGIITNFNRAAEMITGYNKDEMIGQSYLKYDQEAKNDSRSALYTLNTRKESYHRQKNIRTAENTEKIVEFSATLLKDRDQNILGVVETFNDISELNILRDRVKHIETLAALGEMSASVAHEIRNPLAGITGFAGLLDRQIPDDDPKKSLVQSIIVGTTKLNDIITNLLTLTRPQKLNLTPVNLSSFLDSVVEYFKDAIPTGEKEIKIDLDVDNHDITISIDVQLFQQIIINLLKNACDAIATKGKITIKTKSNIFEPISNILEADEKSEMIRLFSDVEITIADNGCGIPAELLQKVFNPFFTTKDEGNGLGLAIVKKIIQLHKGDISIKSTAGKGTTFYINLPLYEQPN